MHSTQSVEGLADDLIHRRGVEVGIESGADYLMTISYHKTN